MTASAAPTTAPTPGSARPARTNWPVALVLVGAGVAGALQIGKAVAALPAVRADLGLSLVAAGWVLSLVNLAGALAGLLIGAVADRVGHRRAVLAGLVVAAVCGAAGAAAPGTPTLLATRVGEGLGLVLAASAVPGLLVRVTAARDHGPMFGIWAAFMPLGIGLATLATPTLLAHGGWRTLWLVTAVVTAGWAILVGAATRQLGRAAARPDQPGPLQAALAVLRAPGPKLLAAIFATYSAQSLAVLGFLPAVLIERYGTPAGTAATLAALTAFLNVPGNLLGGRLGPR